MFKTATSLPIFVLVIHNTFAICVRRTLTQFHFYAYKVVSTIQLSLCSRDTDWHTYTIVWTKFLYTLLSYSVLDWRIGVSESTTYAYTFRLWTLNTEHRTTNTAHITIQLLESHLKRMNYTPKRKIKTKRFEKPHWKGKTRADSQTMRHTQITMVLVHMHDKSVCTSIHIFIFIFIGGLLSKQANNQCMSCTIVHSSIRCSEPDSQSNCVGVYLCNVQFMHALNDQIKWFYLPIAQFDLSQLNRMNWLLLVQFQL